MVKSLFFNSLPTLDYGLKKIGLLTILVTLLHVTGTACAQRLSQIPDAAAQAEAKKLVDEVYADLLDASNNEDRAAAARLLILRAMETKNSPAAKYVMYDNARLMAVEAADTATAMDAIKGLMSSFKDESGSFLRMASISLQSLSRKARNDTEYAAVARAGVEIAEKMIASMHQEDAMDLLSKLKNATLRSRRPELISTYKELVEELKAIEEQTKRITADIKAIKINPDDPSLNLSVGKYHALYRGDWQTGLMMLAKSSDDSLAVAAKADLAGADDMKMQIAHGDKWWALANKHSKHEAKAMYERAKHWYRKALPSSSGIERSLLTKRTSSQGQVTWGDLVLKPGIRTAIDPSGKADQVQFGAIVKQAIWTFDKKPPRAQQRIKLHFDGYLYSPKTIFTEIMTSTKGCLSMNVEVNGEKTVGGSGDSQARVLLIKGYNSVRGSVIVPVVNIENLGPKPIAELLLINEQNQEFSIPAEQWFHDAS